MATLAQIREQYPEYGDLPDGALADAVYAKSYADMPRVTFDQKLGLTRSPPAEGFILPIRRDESGDLHLAVPGLLKGLRNEIASAATYPGDVAAGRAQSPGLHIPRGDTINDEELSTADAEASLRANQTALTTLSPSPAMGTGKTIAAVSEVGPNGRPRIVVTPSATSELATTTPPATGRGAVPQKLVDDANTMDGRLAASESAADRNLLQQTDDLARAAVETERAAANAADHAGNINLSNIFAPDDVAVAIKQTAIENGDFIAARRAVIPQDETRTLAQWLGMSGEDMAKRKVGQAYNAEELFAARQLLVTQATKVRDLAKLAEAGSDLDKAAFAEAMTRLRTIQEHVSGATAEAGRALAQFKMLAGATKEDIARLVEASKASGLEDMARKVNALEDPAKVAAFAAEAFKAKTSDMVLEAWINALLSGPVTHVANMLSNSLVALYSIPEAATAAALSKVTGSGIAAREVAGRVFGLIEGAKDGIRAAWQAYRTEMPTDLASKIETRKFRAIPSANIGGMEIGGKQVRIPGRLLTAEDEFFKAIGYRQEINTLAIRQAATEGLGGRAFAERVAEIKTNPPEAMRLGAREAAEKQTFTNPLGPAGQALTKFANEVPAGMGRVVMPFIRTPLNILKFAAERSPAAPLFKEVRADLLGKNGAIARDNAIARIALGSSVSAVAASYAADGTITGGGPSDPAKRGLMYATGWAPYSVKVGDTYYSYARGEPLGMLMGVAADMVEMHRQMRDDEKANLAALMMGSVSRNLVSKSWMRGPAELIQAVQDPNRYGPRYVQRLLGTAVPTGVAQLAQVDDPFLREARSVLDTIRSRIPGEREKLFVRRDAFGNPIKKEGSLGPDFLSPIYQSAARNDPTIAELLRLNVAPGRLERKIRNTELTDAEYDYFSATTGRAMKASLDALIAKPGWRDLPEAAQVEAIHDVVRASHDVGRMLTQAQFKDLPLRIAIDVKKRKRLDTLYPSAPTSD